MTIKTIILSGYGLNCEKETQHACHVAGGEDVDVVHLSRLVSGECSLKGYHFLIFIGGFLDGDDLGAGRVGANRMKHSALKEELLEFIEEQKLILGICNGFQMLVKLGVLPALSKPMGQQEVSLTSNLSHRFENRWVNLKVNTNTPCIFTKGLQQIELPARHGEGRLEFGSPEIKAEILEHNLVPLQYTNKNGQVTESYPDNPNGSPEGIAALCNKSGTVMGMMPHPEAYHHYTNHPQWMRRPRTQEDGEGIHFFRNAYEHFS